MISNGFSSALFLLIPCAVMRQDDVVLLDRSHCHCACGKGAPAGRCYALAEVHLCESLQQPYMSICGVQVQTARS